MNRAEQLRIDAGLSRAELAERAQVALGTIRRLEDGERVGAGRLRAVADALNQLHRPRQVAPSELQRPAFTDTPEQAA